MAATNRRAKVGRSALGFATLAGAAVLAILATPPAQTVRGTPRSLRYAPAAPARTSVSGHHPIVASTARSLRVYENPSELFRSFPWNGTLGNLVDSLWKELPWYKMPSYLLEMNLIRPSNPDSVQHFLQLLQATANIAQEDMMERGGQKPLEDYVGFSRLSYIHPYDKLSCDWCSIINGISEYLADLLCTHFDDVSFEPQSFDLPGMPHHTPMRWQIRLHHMAPFTASALHAEEVPFEQAACTVKVMEALRRGCSRSCETTASAEREEARIAEIIRPVLECCWFGEAQEQRWCPFRHAAGVASALRVRPYYALDSDKQEELNRALRMLREDGRVTCRNCASELDSLLDGSLLRRAEQEEAPSPVAPEGDTIERHRRTLSPKLWDYFALLLATHFRGRDEGQPLDLELAKTSSLMRSLRP